MHQHESAAQEELLPPGVGATPKYWRAAALLCGWGEQHTTPHGSNNSQPQRPD